MRRLGAVCGIAAPVSFVSAWALGGVLREDGYSPVSDAISQLAAEGAPTTRPLMTAGFVVFGLLTPVFGATAARVTGAPGLRWSIPVAGIATLLVGATPLTGDGGTTQDAVHGLFAGAGYVAMALSPLLGAVALRRRGQRKAALASAAVGAVSVASLVLSVVPSEVNGLFQRLGLGVVDAWFVAVATQALRRR